MGGIDATQTKQALPAQERKVDTVAGEWSKKTGLPARAYVNSKEFLENEADMSKLDKYGRPINNKSGNKILRFR